MFLLLYLYLRYLVARYSSRDSGGLLAAPGGRALEERAATQPLHTGDTMGTEQSPAAAGGKLLEMQIGAPSSTQPRTLRTLEWGELSVGWMCLVWVCLLSAGLLVSGMRNPLLELLWEAESGPAIGAPVQSLGHAATRSQRQPGGAGGGPPGAAATQPCVDFSGTYVSPQQPRARPFSGCFSSSS